MSIELRIRYQVRSFTQFLRSLQIPDFFTGTVAKTVVSALVLSLLIGYVLQISHLTTSGYEIAVLEKKVSALNDDAEKLNAEVASYQSIASIQKRLQGAAMVPVKNISYIKASAMTVAER